MGAALGVYLTGSHLSQLSRDKDLVQIHSGDGAYLTCQPRRPFHSLLSHPHPPGHVQGVLSNHKDTAHVDEIWYESYTLTKQTRPLVWKRPFFCVSSFSTSPIEDRIPLDQKNQRILEHPRKEFLLFLFKAVPVNQPQAANLQVINNCCGVQRNASARGSR